MTTLMGLASLAHSEIGGMGDIIPPLASLAHSEIGY